jgi:hypothetical protein
MLDVRSLEREAAMTDPSSRWPEQMGYPLAQPVRPMSINPAMRAATVDRERAVDVLKAAFAEGRLDQEEYNDRMARAYAAKTYGELVALTGDLPAGPLPMPMPPPWQQSPWQQQPWQQPVPRAPQSNGVATAALVLGLFGMAIPAIICGHIARGQIRRTGENGDGMAVAGLVLGYGVLAFCMVLIVAALAAASHGGAAGGGYPGFGG